jgi:cysteine desulfurase/selenocysteine lyase
MKNFTDNAIDIDRVRADTPGLEKRIHLLACGAAPSPVPVLKAITDHLALEATIGGYEAATAQSVCLEGVYDQVASLIGARSDEIALVENATVGWCHAFYALELKEGDRVLTCHAEYAANYVAFLQRAKRDGIFIDIVPDDETGALDVNALETMIGPRTALIAITWVPTNGGLVNPAAEVGRVARAHNIPYLLDACQAVGQMPIDVTAIGCDFLSATGRKFLRGPRGTGFLYVRKALIETLEPITIDHFAAPWVAADRYELRSDARRFETWENSYALRAGLGAAVVYARAIGMEQIQQRARALANGLRDRLLTLPGARIMDQGNEQCAIVSFTVAGLHATDAVARLRDQDINIGASSPSSTLIDSESRALPVLLRAAPHYYNTEDELDSVVDAIDNLRSDI